MTSAASDRIQAEVLVRDGLIHWPAGPLTGQDGCAVPLASIGFSLPLTECYRGT
jgi:hypothetical protein